MPTSNTVVDTRISSSWFLNAASVGLSLRLSSVRAPDRFGIAETHLVPDVPTFLWQLLNRGFQILQPEDRQYKPVGLFESLLK